MNALIYGNSINTLLERKSLHSGSILKSSGSGTPAVGSKVLRWKDLEAAAAQAAAELEHSSVQSVFGSEDGERELLNGHMMWNNENEDLFL